MKGAKDLDSVRALMGYIDADELQRLAGGKQLTIPAGRDSNAAKALALQIGSEYMADRLRYFFAGEVLDIPPRTNPARPRLPDSTPITGSLAQKVNELVALVGQDEAERLIFGLHQIARRNQSIRQTLKDSISRGSAAPAVRQMEFTLGTPACCIWRVFQDWHKVPAE